jgi:dihydropteroate synthase
VKLRCRDCVVALDRTAVMGVLNVTPDSFSDGGLWFQHDAAVQHGRAMVSDGAAIVDIGGESTRPGASTVHVDEEIRRILPVVEAVAKESDAVVSIDTRKPAVARRAIEAGAAIVNDTSGETAVAGMDELIAATGAGIIVMHSRGNPATMQSLSHYDDVVDEVRAFLSRRADEVIARGVSPDSIAVDPGIGFAKRAEHSLTMLNRLDEIVSLGFPVVVGTSRKSFIGSVLDVPEGERLEGTAATVAWAVTKGAHIVRVHDVAPIARVVRTTEAIMHAGSRS